MPVHFRDLYEFHRKHEMDIVYEKEVTVIIFRLLINPPAMQSLVALLQKKMGNETFNVYLKSWYTKKVH